MSDHPPARSSGLKGRIRPTRFGEMLRLYRTVCGLTLRDVAKASHIGHATLMRIEHGQAFDVQTWMRLWSWMFEPDERA